MSNLRVIGHAGDLSRPYQAGRDALPISRQLVPWLFVAIVTFLHYSTGPEMHWQHDIFRRLYYLPILLAAFSNGMRGGLLLACVVTLAYAPHAFTHLTHMDPAPTLDKALEMILYFVVGGIAGRLVDQERLRRVQLLEAAERLRVAFEDQQTTQDQLIRAGRLASQGEIVAGIAHEIRNPLHALKGTAEIVDRAVPPDAPERPLWLLHLKEIDRLETVAERFLSFARPSPPARREVSLPTVLEHTVNLIQAQAKQSGVEVFVDRVSFGELEPVQIDEQQITQVLLNIGLNAIQACRRPGNCIRFGIEALEVSGRRYAVISVSNDGPRIEPENLERIFDPFITTKSEGVGLGLSIASRIVEQHEGYITVENRPDPVGVVFRVHLPS